MIIGLNGRLKAGKDTTYGIIKELYEDDYLVTQVSFAKALKSSAAASIGVSVVSLENWKGDEEVYFTRPDGSKFTAREYLQWYGTEGHREVFGDNFWVDMALPYTREGQVQKYDDAIYVVTDMRFPNEAQRVIDLGGHTVKVVREAETKFSAHPSEQNIDHMIQYKLDNTGTLDELRERVRFMMDHFLGFAGTFNAQALFPPYVTAAEAEELRGWRD